jgi:amino acid adenylation domain-containing protein
LSQLLEHAARSRPDHPAVEDPERGVSLSYRALDAVCARLRDAFLRCGVVPGDRIGVCGPKSVGTLAAILAALKAGAAYVSVDANAPAQRNAGILRDCSAKVVFAAAPVAAQLVAALGTPQVRSIDIDLPPECDGGVLLGPSETEAGAATDRGVGDVPSDLAYILYTSGSTGRPKGVMHTHRSALSFVDWCSETLEPRADDRFASHAPFHFDLSILDIFLALKHGSTLVLVGEEIGKQPAGLAPLIAERGVSVWYSTPSILRLLTEYGKLERHRYPSLRLVLFAGEVFPVKHLRVLKALWPTPRYFNLYGPTETNVCTFFEVPTDIPQDRSEPFPIGVPCSNDRTMVVDTNEAEARHGEEGELYVAGGSVMAGYWHLPERTREAFHVDASGTRWYKTGDVVREDTSGQLLFVGRRDRMVKRRGYRIELGEIEAALYRHPAIAEAAAVAVADDTHGVLVKAFVTVSSQQRPSTVDLKRFCAEHLPLYMVPDLFSMHAALPKTSTGKLDYQRLVELD